VANVLALDQGTTSSRAIVFDESAAIRAVAQREFRQIFPRPGWVEHDPLEIWRTQALVAAEALDKASISASDLAGVGIANQRETTIIWDRKSGEPIHNAIVWQDRRTSDTCRRLIDDGLEPLVRERAGLVIDAYFAATKIAWILDHVDGARRRAQDGRLAFGTVDAWLAFKLTGIHATDASNASRTLLYNIHRHHWDDDLLDAFHVPRAILPKVHPTSGRLADINDPGPLQGANLAAMIGDQQGATAGQACLEPGLAKNTYGTGCFLLMNTGDKPRESNNRLLTTIAWRIGDETTYALEGGVFVGGAIVQWLRDGLGVIDAAPDIETLAATVDDTDDVFLVPALAGLGAPHWDPYARGIIIGLTRGTTVAHVARAALEGIAFEVADLADAMRADAGLELTELRVDGGAAANDLLMQMQADLLQIPVVRPTVLETTALGAAYMAGLATGVWNGFDDIRANWKAERTFEPSMTPTEAEKRRARWNDAVERAKGWHRKDDDA
jgi:glycerol kinase